MEQRIGSCSICGGDVMGFEGAWWSITPPPPPSCSSCGAVRKVDAQADVIEMVPRRAPRVTVTGITSTGTANYQIGSSAAHPEVWSVWPR